MRILYIGYQTGVFWDRCQALRRLGHEVVVCGRETWMLGKTLRYQDWWNMHASGWGIRALIRRHILERLPSGKFDLAWVDTNPYIDSVILEKLRRQCFIMLHYNQDDPFGTRDHRKWNQLRTTLPLYDLVVVLREVNVNEARMFGARRVYRVNFAADEISHKPVEMTPELRNKWNSEVLFLGTWFPERGSFLQNLIAKGVPLTIRGERWNKAKEWDAIQRRVVPGNLRYPEYAYAIQSAKICIGMLSKGNRDLHTTRSLEIPSLGSVLCAERTSEHLLMYEENREAVFWSDAAECADKCLYLLSNPAVLESIRTAGRNRFTLNKSTNEEICRKIILEALNSRG